MPTSNRKANKLIEKGRAVRRFDRGLFYIQLTDREDGYIQAVVVGIDPGSKKEAFTVKSAAYTYLNVQADAITWVKEAEETSTQMRRTRRSRKTPYRKCRPNRCQSQFRLPPSTRARWGWKLRLCNWLAHRYPITTFVVEDIKARTRQGKKRWNISFSPLEVGKHWFYRELGQLAEVQTRNGWETKQERDHLGLKKSRSKMSDKFESHCIDSWVLANTVVAGHTAPDNTHMLYIVPRRFHRRQLHRFQPEKGGIRKPYGGTLSLGYKRGSWVKPAQYGVCYVDGSSKGRLSLHSLQDGRRLCQNAKSEDCQHITFAGWRIRKEQALSSPS